MEDTLALETQEKQSLYVNGKRIEWVPLKLQSRQGNTKITNLLEPEIEKELLSNFLWEAKRPPVPSTTKNVNELEPGEYHCIGFHRVEQRRGTKTHLFLKASDDDDAKPYWGVFLEKAVVGVDLSLKASPMLCRVGEKIYDPKSKRKHRSFCV